MFDGDGNAGDEATATSRNQNSVYVRHVINDLRAHRARASQNVQMIEAGTTMLSAWRAQTH
jgi:hypothetical protein